MMNKDLIQPTNFNSLNSFFFLGKKHYGINISDTNCIKLRNWLIVLVGRVFANGLEDQGSITGRIIPKT